MPQGSVDYSLYLVTDRGLSRGRPMLEVVAAALTGGVTCVQLREKTLPTREFIQEALALAALLRDRGVPLIINDRVDVAQAVDADGVHLGRSDMPLAMARRILGTSKLIGISVESLEDAVAAERQGADYLGVSPVFATSTKADAAPPLGLEGLKAIRQAVSAPLVGIGGVNRSTAAAVIRSGADGVAVVSAIVAAARPGLAAREILDEIIEARTQWG